jgi:hypothetical protein
VTGFKTPAPNGYEPKDNLKQNVKSNFKYNGSFVFGKSQRTFIDINWKPNETKELPAPG